MTVDQLRILVVAEREHVTRAASGAIATLEARHDVKLFNRVGRGIELTDTGRMFLGEARNPLLANMAG